MRNASITKTQNAPKLYLRRSAFQATLFNNVSRMLGSFTSELGTKQSCSINSMHFVDLLFFNPGLAQDRDTRASEGQAEVEAEHLPRLLNQLDLSDQATALEETANNDDGDNNDNNNGNDNNDNNNDDGNNNDDDVFQKPPDNPDIPNFPDPVTQTPETSIPDKELDKKKKKKKKGSCGCF